jgi:hypothetical protein
MFPKAEHNATPDVVQVAGEQRKADMRLLIALIIVIYLIGVGVVLSPVVQANWDSETASKFASSIAEALPDAFAWPVRFAHAAAGT